jgi:hypothetical protein
MSGRIAARLAWSLWGMAVVFSAAGLVFGLLPGSAEAADRQGLAGVPVLVALVTLSTVGALVASRRPEHPIGWLWSAAGLVSSAAVFANQYSVYVLLAKPGVLAGGLVTAWLNEWLPVSSFGLAFVFVPLLFPDGRLPSRRWRPVAWLAASAVVVASFGAAFHPGALREPFEAFRNPVGIEGAEFLDPVTGAAFALIGASILVAAASLIVRLRRAKGEARQQLKWFVYAVVLVVLSFPAVNLSPVPGFEVVLFLALLAIPGSTAVAILRYRLYEIDLIIRRTLVYGVVSAGLAGLYFAIVVALQQVFSPLTGGSDLAIAGSTLAVAALFRPVRRRVQAVVDRRFYRRKYDAQKTLEAFNVRLREEIDLEALTAELAAVVRETMQPAQVSLWLRPVKGQR